MQAKIYLALAGRLVTYITPRTPPTAFNNIPRIPKFYIFFWTRWCIASAIFSGDETRCTTRFFLLTEKEYSDDLHIKCARGGEVRELPIVKIELRMEGRGIDSRRAQKKTAVQYSCFVWNIITSGQYSLYRTGVVGSIPDELRKKESFCTFPAQLDFRKIAVGRRFDSRRAQKKRNFLYMCRLCALT